MTLHKKAATQPDPLLDITQAPTHLLLLDKKAEALINVSNKEFLQAIFGEKGYTNAHICAFPDDPAAIEQSDAGRCWGGYLASDRKLRKLMPEDNQYFTVSQFHRDAEGYPRRRKNLFDAGFILVVDDVSEKIPIELANKLPKPSYKLFTSEKSEQWGYILENPEEDRGRLENLTEGLVKQGLAPDGKDPGMVGSTRLVRMPGGSNTKAKRFVNGLPFKCYLSEWHPERLHSIESLAEAYKIDLDAPRNEVNSVSVVSGDPTFNQHPVWNHVTVNSTNGDWSIIDCVNVEKHTGGVDPSGAAIMIRDDGSVAYQCHHGACNGDNKHKKFTGNEFLKRLGIFDEVAEYIIKTGVKNRQQLAINLGMRISTAKENGEEASLISLNMKKPDDLRYIYLSTSNKFYDCLTGELLSNESLDNLYLQGFPGGRNKDRASAYLHKTRVNKLSLADGLGWVPFSNKRPSRDEIIIDFDDKRLVNSWRGLKRSGTAGDPTKWLELTEFLLPIKAEREIIIKYLALILQRPDIKPSFTILHRGAQGVGKDTMLIPIMRALGPKSSGEVTLDNLIGSWGNYIQGKKFLIIEEVAKAQNRSVNNSLKTLLAPTAGGVKTLNLKGGAVVSQSDVLTTYIMSNRKQSISLDADDRRYFVVDSYVKAKPPEYYAGLQAWYANDGIDHVINYLLNLDLGGFNASHLPFETAAMLEMQISGRYDYEITIEEMVNSETYPFAEDLFVLQKARDAVREAGATCVTNSLVEALEAQGFTKIRGAKKINGKTKASPHYFVKNEIVEYLTTNRERYEYWLKWDNHKV